MKKLKLYSRIECPLCEYAEELLMEAGIAFEAVDIDGSTEMIKQYHVRIPVISNGVEEVNWPFTAEQAMALVKEQNNG